MSIHKHIRDKNLSAFKDSLDIDSASKEDTYGDTPIEMLVKNFNSSTEINMAKLMAQLLINMGADITRIRPYIENKLNEPTIDNNTRAFLTFLKKSKVYNKSGRRPSTQPKTNNTRSFQSATGSKKSNYSAQELLQLKKIAGDYNLQVINTNHLALRIINHLIKNNTCPNCNQ